VQFQPRQVVKHSNIIKSSSITTTDAGFKVLIVVTNKNTIFLDVTFYNLVEIYQHIKGTYFLHLQGQRGSPEQVMHFALPATCSLLVVCSIYALTLMTEAIYATEILIKFYQTTQSHIPENNTFQLLHIFPPISRSLK
jgi:hypothetical protein